MRQYTQARQNKIKLISLLVFIILLMAAFLLLLGQGFDLGMGLKNPSGKLGAVAYASEREMFMGLRKPATREIAQLWPEAAGKPLLVEFHSKYCHDCKRMAPVLKSTLLKFTNVRFKAYEIMDDKQKFPAVFNTFRPVSVPVLVFITPGGRIQNVLYNYQTEAVIAVNLQKLSLSK